jgi:hypothetical protein
MMMLLLLLIMMVMMMMTMMMMVMMMVVMMMIIMMMCRYWMDDNDNIRGYPDARDEKTDLYEHVIYIEVVSRRSEEEDDDDSMTELAHIPLEEVSPLIAGGQQVISSTLETQRHTAHDLSLPRPYFTRTRRRARRCSPVRSRSTSASFAPFAPPGRPRIWRSSVARRPSARRLVFAPNLEYLCALVDDTQSLSKAGTVTSSRHLTSDLVPNDPGAAYRKDALTPP